MIRALVLWLAGAAAAVAACPEGDAPFPVFYGDHALFEGALESTSDERPAPDPVHGVTVPHHLEAPDLIALGLKRAAGRRPDRIVVMFPDHFRKLRGRFGTTPRGFDTLLGPVLGDPEGAARLTGSGEVAVEDSCLFQTEHGLRALLPFIARLFPDVPVLPLAIAIGSGRDDWDRMLPVLSPLIGRDTLLVQATDFSHYLPHHAARLRDQQVLNLMAEGDPDRIAALTQPGHIDSPGALYLMTRLMAARGAEPVVIANRNLQEKTDRFIAETTSYVVALYQPPGSDPGPAPGAAPVHMLGGDVFVGRSLVRYLSDDLAADRVAQAVLGATRGLPLIANLEGVLLPEMPGNLEHLTLGMPADLAVDMARRMNVAAFGLANNHASDIGASGRAETRRALDAAGIPHAGPGEALDLPGLRIVALTDLDGSLPAPRDRLDDAMLDRAISDDPTVPVVAFIHWGEEFVTTPGPREEALALALSRRGVVAIVGAHPHRASAGAATVNGGDTVIFHSLGNLLFDQLPPESNGALVEVRSFPQGTVFLRQMPLPDLYPLARLPR
ncbi:hypothetical protein ATO6_01685 [Oceanicola sp. 22II-s10i]|uniref:AmmeMemoRadiSam system protein B n=1 Tax=Oceanicola sp. 22II-s10i TaxID=1317116 RepID=UPI000B5267BA|nr:AmmeMemoRadiSam system protein B [Oceanicola sp. 22II-s10i]OWU85667.1 hypothetical protein ATO6_01685 [Oceanicola sp. 22II-s10i]